MNEDEAMARAMKCGRSAVIPLGCIDEDDEVAGILFRPGFTAKRIASLDDVWYNILY